MVQMYVFGERVFRDRNVPQCLRKACLILCKYVCRARMCFWYHIHSGCLKGGGVKMATESLQW